MLFRIIILECREALAAAYGLQSQLVQTALDFAETEEFADLYCFAYCLTGGPMKDAFAQATMHSFSKGNLLERYMPMLLLVKKELTLFDMASS